MTLKLVVELSNYKVTECGFDYVLIAKLNQGHFKCFFFLFGKLEVETNTLHSLHFEGLSHAFYMHPPKTTEILELHCKCQIAKTVQLIQR